MEDNNNNLHAKNGFQYPDCMCRMCRVRRGGRLPLNHKDNVVPPTTIDSHLLLPLNLLPLNDDEWRKIRLQWRTHDDENAALQPIPQNNNILSQDLNDLKKTLVKYTNDNKLNLSGKQIEIFIRKIFEELHKKYIIIHRSKL